MGRRIVVKRVGAPGWVVTFTDLTSLLTTFFVLLFTFSTTEPQSENNRISPYSGSPGIFADTISNLQEWLARPPRSRPLEAGQESGQEVDAAGDLVLPDGKIVTEGELARGARLRIEAANSFLPGSAAPLVDLRRFLETLGAALRRRPDLVVMVEGYTDSRAPAGGPFGSAPELALERALAAGRALAAAGVPLDRIQARGWGPSPAHPRGGEIDEEGRARNRRVELLVRRR